MPALLWYAFLLLGAAPVMLHGEAPVYSGAVVAAPHEGFDMHTAALVRPLARRLGTGWVVARRYRVTRERRWLDVNRPTQRLWQEGKLQPGRVTPLARSVYAEYQRHLDAASGRTPLDLLVEIHGHARRAKVDGEWVKIQVIELTSSGFTDAELRRIKRHYRRLVAAWPPADRVPLAVDGLDATYTFRGQTVTFLFGASGAKRTGSLRPGKARRALHFELPSRLRFNTERREAMVRLLAKLLWRLLPRRPL